MSLPMAADLLQRGGAVADQRRAFDRCADLAVLDPVGLGAGKHELAVGDVDLTAAEADGVDAVLEVGDDDRRDRRRRPACRCWSSAASGCGHRTFAPPVAGGRHAHQPGVLAVLHVADQHAVLDQGVLARWACPRHRR